jgi:hypothetical protein
VLRSIEVLPGELAHACSDTLVQPSLFHPPGIEAESIPARHAARAGQQAKVVPENASCLPERSRVEVQAGQIGQGAEVNVHRASETVPHRESFFLLTLEIAYSDDVN